MKNFLIPTTLQSDTISAVKSAVSQANSNDCEIVLMIVTDTPNTFSTSQFLREMRIGLTASQEEVLETCRYLISFTKNCTIKIHNQTGLSATIYKGIIDCFNIKLVILTQSYKQETKRIHQYLIQLAANQKCPILHLGSEKNKENFNKALYIENRNGKITVENVQQFLNKNFPLEIVSQTANFEDNFEDAAPFLNEAILKHDIDLLVQTRKSKKIKFKKNNTEDINEKFGLPILSLYEELV